MSAVEVSEIVRNWAIVVAAAAGGGVAIWRAIAADRQSRAQAAQARTADLQRSSELFFRCLEGLESENLASRVSAVLVLESIARDEESMTHPSFLALQAFLRNADSSEISGEPPLDVQEALRALSIHLRDQGAS